MRFSGWLFVLCCFAVAATFILGQPPIRPEQDSNSRGANGNAAGFVARMLTLDANRDGILSNDEVTDSRLLAIFDRADADRDGIVTTEELTALYQKESSTLVRGGPGGGFGPGGPGGFGPRGPGGFGPPPIGQILPLPIQDMLQLTDVQRKRIVELQKQVDSSLAEILTGDQKRQLQEMRDRGPGGGPGDFGPSPDGPGGNRGGPLQDDRRPARRP